MVATVGISADVQRRRQVRRQVGGERSVDGDAGLINTIEIIRAGIVAKIRGENNVMPVGVGQRSRGIGKERIEKQISARVVGKPVAVAVNFE